MYTADFHNFCPTRTSIATYAVVVIAICLLCACGLLIQKHNALVLEGIKQLGAHDSDRALVDLNEAIGKFPFESHAYFYRALAYEQKGSHVRALRDLDTSARYGESKSSVLIARACIESAANGYEKAAEYCTVSALGQPNDFQAYAVRAAIHGSCHQYELATADCDNGLRLCHDPPLRARLLRQRGIAEINTGKGTTGLTDLSGALSIEPDASTYILRANTYRLRNQLAEAVSDYTQAIKLQPQSYDARFGRGTCYVALHQDRAALNDFNRALAINPNSEKALIQRGSIYAEMKLWQQAANDFQDATNINPFIKEAQDKFALACDRLRNGVEDKTAIASRKGGNLQ